MTDEMTVDPVLRMRSRFDAVTDDAGVESLRIETTIDDGGGVTPHVHPVVEEVFDVVAGRVEFLSGRRWTSHEAGAKVVVPPGTRHAFRNRSGAPATIVCHATPPQSLRAFLEDTAAMSRAGAITRRGIPSGLDGLLRGAVLIEEHREMVTLLAPLPPRLVQRVVIPPLARAGARRGYRPGNLGAPRP